jgi:hypothetical protein
MFTDRFHFTEKQTAKTMNTHSDSHNKTTSTIQTPTPPQQRPSSPASRVSTSGLGKQASMMSIASNHSSKFFRLAILRSLFPLRFVYLETGVPGSTWASLTGERALETAGGKGTGVFCPLPQMDHSLTYCVR